MVKTCDQYYPFHLFKNSDIIFNIEKQFTKN